MIGGFVVLSAEYSWSTRHTMKKILLQLDPDLHASVFDTIVGFDGGADEVIGYSSVTPGNVGPIVEGAIFTRAPKEKRNTALFIGGTVLDDGMALLEAIQGHFFANFRVSVMLDSNGSNTTSAAGVACLAKTVDLAGKRALVLAGTGPVGQRAALMLARAGAEVSLTSRRMERARQSCDDLEKRYGIRVTPVSAPNNTDRARALEGCQVLFSAGASGVNLLAEEDWRDRPELEVLLDANAVPPAGLKGVDLNDRAQEKHGKKVWGAIGFGGLKLLLHRRCIAKLFERNDQVLDALEMYELAGQMS